MTLKLMNHNQWKEFQSYAREILNQAKQQGVSDPLLSWDRKFLGSCDLGERFSCEIFGWEVSGQIVSTHMAYFAKKRRAGWGKYITSHYAYTLYGLRRQGYGSTLLRKIEALAAERGYDRMKTLACSYGGFRLHCCLGQEVWGINDNGDLRIDTPLVNGDGKYTMEFPSGVPWCARDVCKAVNDKPSPQQILAWISDPKGNFRAPIEEATQALKKHGFLKEVFPKIA